MAGYPSTGRLLSRCEALYATRIGPQSLMLLKSVMTCLVFLPPHSLP